MNLLLTGATGTLGQLLLESLSCVDDIKTFFTVREDGFEVPKNCEVIDTRSEKWLDELSKINIQVVVHLASYLTSGDSINDIEKLIDSNLGFGSKILSGCDGIDYFINTGSFSEYGMGGTNLCPNYYYSATKTAFRAILSYFARKNDFRVIHVIPYTIYGGKDKRKKIIDLLISSVNSEKKMDLSPGQQVLDFIHIEDVVEFYHALIVGLKEGVLLENNSEYHVGSGVGTSVKEVSRIIEDITNKPCNVNWGGVPYRKIDTFHSIAPIYKNIKDLGWKSKISIEQGLRKLINGI